MRPRKTTDRRRGLKRRLTFFLLNVFAYPVLWVVLRVWPLTLRWRMNGVEEVYRLVRSRRPLIFAFWHGDLLGIFWNGRRHVPAHRIHIMISPSRDGRFLGRLIRLMGYRSVTGSSASRGVSGLKGLMKVLNRGDYVALALDGPRGPRHVVKPGALFLAQRTGAAIIPVVYRPRRRWVARSWDRLEIPRPFSTIDVYVLSPLEIPAETPHEELMDGIRADLERRMKDGKGEK
ncbi:MAG: lysophospholipid acyltransferase family protein [Candidatus Sumerlaeia bacterium]